MERLPKGYDQMLGCRFDDRVDILRDSGRRSRLGEPTCGMRRFWCSTNRPARAEFEVYQRFAELTTHKMAVLISHRFSTVRTADRIFVLEGALRNRARIASQWRWEGSMRSCLRCADEVPVETTLILNIELYISLIYKLLANHATSGRNQAMAAGPAKLDFCNTGFGYAFPC